MTADTPIAVVGMSGLFPGALDVQTLWTNILAKRDATAEVRARALDRNPRVHGEHGPAARPGLLPALLPAAGFSFRSAGLELESGAWPQPSTPFTTSCCKPAATC